MIRFLYPPADPSWAPVAAMGMFGGGRPKLEPPPAPIAMAPAADDPATVMAKRKKLLEQMGGGRLSTILSEDTGYSGDRLGVR